MALGKNIKRVRLNGGNNAQLKISSTWTVIGHLLKGVIEDITDSTEVTFADGDTTELPGKRKVKITLTIGQTSKEELELIDSLADSTFEFFYYNGIVESKHQAFYFKEIKIIPKLNLESPGAPMQIVLEATAVKQAALVAVTPSTGFPSGAGFTGATPITGKNNYYVIVEEAQA